MKLTPLEIRKQEFNKSMRGYNVEEVRAFLETVADQVDLLQKQANEFSEKVVHLETRLVDFQMMEKTLQETLMKAEESSRRARDDSRREAEITVREAEVEANRIVSEAHSEVERLKSETLMLRARRDAFIKKLKYLLQSQTELIEILEGNDFESPEEKPKETHEDHPPTVS
ncbi:MAG TPA: DivIVA domain-containing protein [Bacteroidetes bacterium]|nr:DivIVA domain-containing protein [Bacteroidota bacterium]